MRLFTLACMLLITQLCTAAPLKNIVVFGDSLSDNGNLYEYMHHQLPQSPPYYSGRFSNGPIWAEDLAQNYFGQASATQLLDYAFGGAGVVSNPSDDDDDVLFTLNREIDTYLLAHNGQADPNSLFIVWIGGNNYLGLPEEMPEAVQEVMTGTEKGVKRLTQAGAKNILLINLPDIGSTPLAQELEAPEAFSALSKLHNEQLALKFNELRQQDPSVHWIYFDANKVFKDVLADPAQYGFKNIQSNCYDAIFHASSSQPVLKMVASVRPKAAPEECDDYFFFDLLHPTERVHAITAEHIKALLDKEHITFQVDNGSTTKKT